MQAPRQSPTRRLFMGAAAAAAATCASPFAAAQGGAMADAASAVVSPVALVDALSGVFGKHMVRSSHAKGICMAGQFEAAEDAARRTVALAPSLADGHAILGDALQALGRTREAIASYRRAIDLAPDDADAHASNEITWTSNAT